jgi:uncharacterized protein involved in outer membrane biogenesis
MPKSFLLALYALAAALALALLAGVIMLLAWRGHASAQLQAAASQAIGMQVTIDGPLALKFFPSVAVSLRDVHIRNRDSDVASAGQATLAIELVSLLRRQVRIPRVELSHVTLSVERGRDGRLNVEAGSPGASVIPGIESTDLAVTDLALSYSNRQQGTHLEAQGCDVTASDVRVAASDVRTASSDAHTAASGGADLMNRLSLSAHVACRQISIRDLTVSDLRFTAVCGHGVLQTGDLTLRAFGGQGSAVLRADFTAPVPSYQLHAALSKFRLGEFSRNFSQKSFGDGVMDFSTGLTMAGKDADAITRSGNGDASLHGTDLTLAVGNLDAELSQYRKTQHFNLVDLGGLLLAGPIGLAVTKGYDYAKVISNSGGSSRIQTFISEWHVDHGVAQATDVAMSTRSNRVALKGGLDFVNQSFQDATVAVIDRQGCAVVEQKVRGSFSHPDVGEPNIVSSLAGPALHLLDKARHLVGGPVGGGHCQVFYSGALPPPPADAAQ